jgi:hypothetical protein
MFVCCECCVLPGRGLCDGLITRPEKSYRLWCVLVCDLGTSRMTRLELVSVVNAGYKKKKSCSNRQKLNRILRNSHFYYHLHVNPPSANILCRINTVHMTHPVSLQYINTLLCRSLLRYFKSLSLHVFIPKYSVNLSSITC